MKKDINEEFDHRIMQLDMMPEVLSEDEKEMAWKEIVDDISPQSKMVSVFFWIGTAAAILLIAVTTVLLVKSKPESYVTNANAMMSLSLDDGSEVTLDRQSQLTVNDNFGGNIRSVSLEGQAYFKIAKNPDQPFVISTPKGKVQVLGTSFNVLVRGEAFEVAVTSGTVELISGKQKLLLNRQETGILQEGILKRMPWNPNDLAWLGTLEFNGENLSKVANTLNELFGKSIQLEGPISDCTITAKIEFDTMEDVLEVIAETLDLSWRKDGETIILQGNGC